MLFSVGGPCRRTRCSAAAWESNQACPAPLKDRDLHEDTAYSVLLIDTTTPDSDGSSRSNWREESLEAGDTENYAQTCE